MSSRPIANIDEERQSTGILSYESTSSRFPRSKSRTAQAEGEHRDNYRPDDVITAILAMAPCRLAAPYRSDVQAWRWAQTYRLPSGWSIRRTFSRFD